MRKATVLFLLLFPFIFAAHFFKFEIFRVWNITTDTTAQRITFKVPLIANSSWQHISAIHCRTQPRARVVLKPEKSTIRLIVESWNTEKLSVFCAIEGYENFSSLTPQIKAEWRRCPIVGSAENATGLVKLIENVHRYLKYDKTKEGLNRTPEQIIKDKRGVCRDYAVLAQYLAKCGGLNVNFVSGFLVKSGKAEIHAWNSWHNLVFDPTSGEIGDLSLPHIAVQILPTGKKIPEQITAVGANKIHMTQATRISIMEEKQNQDVRVKAVIKNRSLQINICPKRILPHDQGLIGVVKTNFPSQLGKISNQTLEVWLNNCVQLNQELPSQLRQPGMYEIKGAVVFNNQIYPIDISYVIKSSEGWQSGTGGLCLPSIAIIALLTIITFYFFCEMKLDIKNGKQIRKKK